MAADEVVKLVAVEAVAQMRAPERSEEMDKEVNRAKGAGKQKSCAQGNSVIHVRLDFGQ